MPSAAARDSSALACFLPGTQVAQHPASEVHPAARETRHLAAFHFGGMAVERLKGECRAACQGMSVAGEQQRVQSRRRGLHPDLPTSGRAQE
jgi:hypothetical protein